MFLKIHLLRLWPLVFPFFMQELNEILKTIGTKVKLKRSEMKMTQEEIAKLTELGSRSYQRIEAGKISPNLKSIFKISKTLNIPLENLVSSSHDFIMQENFHLKKYPCIPDEIYSFTNEQLLDFTKFILTKHKHNFLLHHFSDIKKSTSVNYACPEYFLFNKKSAQDLNISTIRIKEQLFNITNQHLWDIFLKSSQNYFYVRSKIKLGEYSYDVASLFHIISRDSKKPEAVWIFKDLTEMKKIITNFKK